MNTDPMQQLVKVFGELVQRSRLQRNWTEERLANAAGLPNAEAVAQMERGDREPRLTELFMIAEAFGDPPGITFMNLVAAWAADPVSDLAYGARRTDFARLFRLGYSGPDGEFREQHRVYGAIDDATAMARHLNMERRKRSLKPLDTITIYIRMGFALFRDSSTDGVADRSS
jgi:transcriptional regulator with XRE-family HTH domain